MILYTVEHTYKYECEKICRLFFPAERILFACDMENVPEDTKTVITEISDDGDSFIYSCKAVIDGKEGEYSFTYVKDGFDSDSQRERLLAKAIVRVLSDITGKTPPWGILTGIRPAKLMRKYMLKEGEDKARETFLSFFEVSPEKTELALTVAKYEEGCIRMTGEKSFSLYVSIPFCPTRCSYCSFVSHSIDKAGKLIPDYVEKLCLEIEQTSRLARELGLKLETVYIGGGTPTSFSCESLGRIIDALNTNFEMDKVKEFTVEAGRPDTIDRQKLQMLKDSGVTRISINPQTFSDRVLENILRPHSAQDTVDKYLLARSLGFNNINMDLIAGLPGDDFEGFRKSLDKACELSPENITVHTLSMKRSADMVTGDSKKGSEDGIEKMVEYANERLSAEGYSPYYMYRQSKTAGNLENVGWCRNDTPCLYNIYMMEEIHTVLSVGAGSVTKLVEFGKDKLIRIYNYKYPYEYISGFDTLSERKNEIRKFYSDKEASGEGAE